MMDVNTYIAFLVVAGLLVLMPGPGQALILANTMVGGRHAGLRAALGLNLGTLVHAAAAACGLSALLAESALAFALLKYLGAAYLILLAWLTLRGKPGAADAEPVVAAGFRQSLLTGLLNPKVALFFLAFLPQFVDPAGRQMFLQFMLLGASMAIMDVLYALILVTLAARLGERLGRHAGFRRWQARVMASVLLALGLRLAWQTR